MDKMEKFLSENRLRLDVEPLSDDFNMRLSAALQQKRKQKNRTYFMVAASFLILVVSGTFILQPNEQISSITQRVDVENPYQDEINSSIQQIALMEIPSQASARFEDFIIQLQIIEKQQDIYKAQVEKYGYTDEMIQQIIYNYELQLIVLKKLQTEISKFNNMSNPIYHEYTKTKINI